MGRRKHGACRVLDAGRGTVALFRGSVSEPEACAWDYVCPTRPCSENRWWVRGEFGGCIFSAGLLWACPATLEFSYPWWGPGLVAATHESMYFVDD